MQTLARGGSLHNPCTNAADSFRCHLCFSGGGLLSLVWVWASVLAIAVAIREEQAHHRLPTLFLSQAVSEGHLRVGSQKNLSKMTCNGIGHVITPHSHGEDSEMM